MCSLGLYYLWLCLFEETTLYYKDGGKAVVAREFHVTNDQSLYECYAKGPNLRE